MAKEKVSRQVPEQGAIEDSTSNQPVELKLTFDQWWAQVSSRYDFGDALKKAVAHHMRARGFWKTQEWNKGLRDFGFNVPA